MRPNIILVLLDGARWDRLSSSSRFNKLQSKGFLFNNITTAMPYTVGAVNVIFSGLYGKENGVDGYYKVLDLKKSVKTFAEILKNNGYYTGCDLLHKNIITERGFDIHQAHNEYEDDLPIRHREFLKSSFEAAREAPVFCFLHYTKIHRITVSEVLKKYEWDDSEFYDNIEQNLKRYDNVFEEACEYSSKIIDTIEELGKKENTIIIFFSDHGTGVGERYGERNYGSFTYEETIRAFYLFISKDILTNKISSKLHSALDIFPTVLKLCNVLPDNLTSGRSLDQVLMNEKFEEFEDEHNFAETGALHGPFPSPEKSNVFCIKTKQYKLIYLESSQRWEFYDLSKDHVEKNNIIGENPALENELKKKLLDWMNR